MRVCAGVLFMVSFATVSVASDALRNVTVTNQCPFDVSLQSVGSNASAIGCSPSAASAQANCPSGFVCYAKNKTTNYCVAGSAVSGATLPLSSQTDITLDASSCPSSSQITDSTSNSWGQCQCSSDSGCANNQACQSVTGNTKQCYWSLPLANGGKLARTTGKLTIALTPNSQDADAMVASGKLYAKFGCNVNGQCLSDNTQGAPATLVEFTFQNNNDWYDVSYINGVNLPATMQPVLATDLDYQSDDPYRCLAAGGDAGTMDAIFAYQKKHKLSGNSALKPFACTNDYSTVFDGTNTGFNFVSSESNPMDCSKASPCTNGLACGLTLDAVKNDITNTTCGHRLGYWTYAQFCAANSSYNNSTLGISCGTTKDYAYALCENQAGMTDTGPGRSCFNANTTTDKQTCCGYESWTKGTTKQPLGKGDSPVKGVVTSDWRKAILPAVKPIKEGCYLAYSFQYDDPFSTFTCATTGSGINATSYELTLCPGGGSAGIDPPAPASCSPTVPSGYSTDQFTVGVPDGITVSIDTCKNGSCGKPVLSPDPATSTIYKAPAGGGHYQITASNGSTSQSCVFDIPNTACITPVNPSSDCRTWAVATDGAWVGRSISVPSF